MAKQIIFGEDVRRSLKKGIDVLAAAVSGTLGPKGHPVAIDKKWGAPTIIDDGVTTPGSLREQGSAVSQGSLFQDQ
jgi:chaperonin GroEL